MRRKKRKKRQSRISFHQSKYLVFTRRNLLWLVIWVAVVAMIYSLFFGSVLKIQRVLCGKDEEDCSEELTAENQRLIGTNILNFKANQHREKIIKSNPEIQDVEISTKLPDTVIINLKSRKPLAQVKTKKSKETLLIDETGVVFAIITDTSDDLPIIEIEEAKSLELGKKTTDDQLLKTLQLTEIILENFIKITKIQTLKDTVQVEIVNNMLVIFSTKNDLEKQVNSLQQILSQATIEAKPKRIDVRTEKPVLIYD